MFDHVVLTASNEGQAEAYRAELAHRGLHPRSSPAAIVVADPGGRRVGSGVSTLLALAELSSRTDGAGGNADPAETFIGKRVCIIHAGGDSRRLPAYAAHGKIFTPLPIESADPRHATLFDLLIDDLASLGLPERGGVVVATGDVYLDLAAHGLAFSEGGVTGVAWASTPERGSRHGVYTLDETGAVTGFLHKPSRESAADGGAIRDDGSVLIDTGVVVLDPAIAGAWVEKSETLRDACLAGGMAQMIDLYGDMLPAMAHGTMLYGVDWLCGGDLSARVIPSCPFLHIGSSAELLDILTSPARHTKGWDVRGVGGSRRRVMHAQLETTPRHLGERVFIESCRLRGVWSCEGDNILVGVPRECGGPVELPQGWGAVCLPVLSDDHGEQELWVAVCFGIEDDFKTGLGDGGTLGNRPMADVFDSAGLDIPEVWSAPGAGSPGTRSLWSARLWTPAPAAEMFGRVGWLLRGETPPAGWRESDRLSLGEVMARVDHRRLLDARDRVLRRG